MKDISLREAQKVIDSWINKFEEGYWPPLSMLAAMVEEIGELSRIINALEGYKKPKEGESLVNLEEELGDILFSLICIANYYKVDLNASLIEVIRKYNSRDIHRWTLKRKTKENKKQES